MLEHLYAFNQELNDLVNSSAETHTAKQLQKKIKKIHREYEKKIMEALRYCSCHPESNLLNKAEYQMKLKFDSIAKELVITLQKIENLKKVKEDFQKQIKSLDSVGYDNEDCRVKTLEQIL